MEIQTKNWSKAAVLQLSQFELSTVFMEEIFARKVEMNLEQHAFQFLV